MDLSKAADVTSSDCSPEQSREVQSGWNCDDESRRITMLGKGYEDRLVRPQFSRALSGCLLPLVPVALYSNNPDDDNSVLKFIARKVGEATEITTNLTGIQFELTNCRYGLTNMEVAEQA